ncbi:calcium uptake protein, mitochondrial-like isoform X2 [Rutidosis leptorrhynchoides]|uniref:calcium uptake protein, mitochondrial-like isoform X2 n=1 Tax=Rutidosis leptorrhynchoides TaxID=125765 RepID=UPI003A9A4FEE
MTRLEFSHYDYKLCGTIPAKDFALSMVASGDIRHKSRLLNHVDELDNEPHLKNICITFEEFKSFAELRKKLHPFSLAIFSYGKVNGFLTRKDFQRAANHTCVHSSYFRHSRGLLDTTRNTLTLKLTGQMC